MERLTPAQAAELLMKLNSVLLDLGRIAGELQDRMISLVGHDAVAAYLHEKKEPDVKIYHEAGHG